MKSDFTNAPSFFFHFCTKMDCPRANECLRHLAYLSIRDKRDYFVCVNTHLLPEKAEDCPSFLTVQKEKLAWGIKSVYLALNHEKALALKHRLRSYFGNTHYYRIERQELPLRESDQAYILHCFADLGIDSEPAYERVTEVYKWE